MNLIFGTGGFAKEVDWLTCEIFKKTGVDYRTNYFVAEDESNDVGGMINGCLILSEAEAFLRFSGKQVNAFIAVGSPKVKAIIHSNIKEKLEFCRFPTLIHPDVTYDDRPGNVVFGEGNLICSKNVLTTNIVLGNFVTINLDCTIGHDCVIGEFVTISPGVHISGNLKIGNKVFIGTGAVLLERLEICAESTIGASSTVTKNINVPGVYVGSPARKIR